MSHGNNLLWDQRPLISPQNALTICCHCMSLDFSPVRTHCGTLRYRSCRTVWSAFGAIKSEAGNPNLSETMQNMSVDFHPSLTLPNIIKHHPHHPFHAKPYLRLEVARFDVVIAERRSGRQRTSRWERSWFDLVIHQQNCKVGEHWIDELKEKTEGLIRNITIRYSPIYI